VLVAVWVAVVVLALPALALTAARVSGSELSAAVQVQAFAPLAIPLYAVLVLLLLVVAVRAGHGMLAAVATLVAGTLLSLHVGWVAPLLRGQAAPAGRTFTVMTANLWHGRADVVQVLDAARRHDVELLALQEVRPGTLERLEAAGLTGLFPYRAGAPDATLVLARTPLTRVEPLLDGSGSWAMTWQGRRIFAVHPAYPGRHAAWRRDLAALTEAARAQRPELLLGDFNATRDHRPFRALLRVGYRDAAEQAGSGWQPTWPAPGTTRRFGVPLPPSVAIDHVLSGPGLVATATSTVRVERTDHHALLARLVAPGS
jgi:endonuclease/exonuclease/phosphatase family metal-dependent hydrolase